MDIQIIIQPLLEMLSVYVWPFIRIGAFMVVMPLVGGGFVPTRIRLLLAVVLTMLVAPIVPVPHTLDVLSLGGLVTIIQEVGIGLIMGFLVQLVFDAIALGGQIIAMGMGLGFAVFIDRARGVNIPVLSQLFLMLASLIFLALDGHLTMIQILALSFHSFPISNPGLTMPVLQDILLWTSHLFIFALKIALPAVTSILVVNLSFGVMSRAAPTLNLFAVGFPITMLLGFTVVFLTMGTLTENMSVFLLEALASISRLFEI